MLQFFSLIPNNEIETALAIACLQPKTFENIAEQSIFGLGIDTLFIKL
jgi:hypothetical protein